MWQAQVRRQLVEEELTKLREVPHSMWREVIGRPMRKTARARDNRAYRVRTVVDWAEPGSSNIRVTIVLETASFGRRLQSQSFVLTPENRFLE
jgi:IS5 family transposase